MNRLCGNSLINQLIDEWGCGNSITKVEGSNSQRKVNANMIVMSHSRLIANLTYNSSQPFVK